MNKKEPKKQSTLKKTLLEWGAIGAVILTLYLTGLHTEVIGTMQRAMLWTGLFDAKPVATTTDGPMLSEADYRFEMITNDDERQLFEEYKGDIIFINVWASWCPPCIAEMPTIESLYTELSEYDNIRFILLSMDEDRESAVNFMEGRNFTLPYHFPASRVPSMLRSGVLPTTYVISAEGQIIYKNEGIADYSSPAYRDWLIKLGDSEEKE